MIRKRQKISSPAIQSEGYLSDSLPKNAITGGFLSVKRFTPTLFYILFFIIIGTCKYIIP